MERTLSYYAVLFYKSFSAATDRWLGTYGLGSGSLPFILYVGKHPGCSPSELTRTLGMDWGHSQRSLTRLQEGGFLTREKQGRSYALRLTDLGDQVFRESHHIFESWDRQNFQALTGEETDTLFTLLAKLAQPLEARRRSRSESISTAIPQQRE